MAAVRHLYVMALTILVCCDLALGAKPLDAIPPTPCSDFGALPDGPAINHTLAANGKDVQDFTTDLASKQDSHWLGQRMKHLNAGVRQRNAEKYAKVSSRSNRTKAPDTPYTQKLQYLCHEVASSGDIVLRMTISTCATSDECDYSGVPVSDAANATSSSGGSSGSTR